MAKVITRVVGLCGKARSGKDTAAHFLFDALSHSKGLAEGHIFSMAQTLKAMLQPLLIEFSPDEHQFIFAMECLQGTLKEKELAGLGKSPRELMQTLGTEWGRGMVRDDLWLTVMRNRIKRAEASLASRLDQFEQQEDVSLVVIIPDIRYDNEADLCDRIIRIVRSEAPEVAAHTSEAGVSTHLVHQMVFNNGTEDELRKKMIGIANLVVKGE